MNITFDKETRYSDIKKRAEDDIISPKKTKPASKKKLSLEFEDEYKKFITKKNVLIVLLFGLLILISTLLINLTLERDLTKEEEAREVIDKLSDIFMLPDTNPTFATIVDIQSLRNENAEFYKDAKDGDRLLIFKDEKLAIIYRDKENRIIKIGFVNFENQDSLETVEE